MDICLAITGVVLIALLMWALSRREPVSHGYYGPLDWGGLWDDHKDHKGG